MYVCACVGMDLCDTPPSRSYQTIYTHWEKIHTVDSDLDTYEEEEEDDIDEVHTVTVKGEVNGDKPQCAPAYKSPVYMSSSKPSQPSSVKQSSTL